MELLQRRTRLGRAVKTAGDTQVGAALASALSDVRFRPPKGIAPGLAAAAAVTVGSAAVSALRRREQSPRVDR